MTTSEPKFAVLSAKRTRIMAIAIVVAITLLAYWWWAFESIDARFGSFEGDVVTKWLSDDEREMELVEDFHYVDPQSKRWTAATGAIIDGASIPQLFWSVIGGPFEGRFRSAAVLHDAACGEQRETWQDVHRMFYNALRCARVGVGKSQTMFWAVYQFGPRWELSAEGPITQQPPATPDQSIVAKAERYFAKREFTPAEIEACTVEQIEAEVAKWDAAKSAPADH